MQGGIYRKRLGVTFKSRIKHETDQFLIYWTWCNWERKDFLAARSSITFFNKQNQYLKIVSLDSMISTRFFHRDLKLWKRRESISKTVVFHLSRTTSRLIFQPSVKKAISYQKVPIQLTYSITPWTLSLDVKTENNFLHLR